MNLRSFSSIVVCICFACIATGLAQDATRPQTWSTNWSAFVKKLSAELSKSEDYVDNINAAFKGKKVTWTGEVAKIERPQKAGDSGVIRLSMKPEALAPKSGTPVTLDGLVLEPAAGEWETWRSVSVGDTVRFTTTLDDGTFVPKCVLSILQGMGPNTGKTLAWVNTKGGSSLRVVPKPKK